MLKVCQVYLFTNRNCIFYDETGQQMGDLQRLISWNPLPSYDESKTYELLLRLMADAPQCYMAKWPSPTDPGWMHPITLDELASLIGQGPWFWKKRNLDATLGE